MKFKNNFLFFASIRVIRGQNFLIDVEKLGPCMVAASRLPRLTVCAVAVKLKLDNVVS